MFKQKLIHVSFLGSLMLVAGCASISKQECLVGDWQSVGFKDGNNGQPTARLGSHIEECGKHGVSIDRATYMKGYNEGLQAFCTFDRGLQFGRSGGYYQDVCPANLAVEFRRGYTMGSQIKKVEDQISTIENEISMLEEALVKEAIAYERRRISSEISGKRALVQTLRTQITILESQTYRSRI
jgi:hypothetical protein